jgi:hypothetical protein
MDLLTTILTCSLYASDDALVRAIAEGPSGKNPYLVLNPVTDSAEGDPPPAPKGEAEATARAKGLVAKGGRPLLGLLELPPAWLDVFGRPLASAFDPCTNIAIGTAMLSEFDFECRGARRAPPRDERARLLERVNRRTCVLHKYASAIGSEDFAEVIQLELSVQRALTPSTENAPILAPVSAPHWGSDQLLVPMQPPLAAATPPSSNLMP